MPARKTPFLDARVREKIQASMIINRLSNHVFGKVEMSQTQVRAALGLLAKVIPDLQAVDLSGDLTVNNIVSDEPLSAEQFAEQFCERQH